MLDDFADFECELWERQKKESTVKYEAFVVYRDLGHEPEGTPKQKRTYTNTAKILGKNIRLIQRWAQEGNWKERAREYDNALQKISLQAKRDEIKKMQKLHMQYGMALIKKALQALGQMPEEDLSPRNVLDYIVQGIQIEKAARAENIAIEGGGTATTGSNGVVSIAPEEEASGMMQLVKSLQAAKRERGNE